MDRQGKTSGEVIRTFSEESSRTEMDMNGLDNPHTSRDAQPPARIVVIEDNRSDVFPLERALKNQDLRFELIHLPNCQAGLYSPPGRLRRCCPSEPDPARLIPFQVYRRGLLREIRAAKHLDGVPIGAWSSSQSRGDQSLLKDLGVSWSLPFRHQTSRSGSIPGDRQNHQIGSHSIWRTAAGCPPCTFARFRRRYNSGEY